jgi:hypothetical protein
MNQEIIINDVVDLTENSTLIPGVCVPSYSYYNQGIKLPEVKGKVPGVDVPHFVTGMTIGERRPLSDTEKEQVEHATQTQLNRREPVKEMIDQKVMPSSGTKLVCTECGTQDWHTLILRRKAGLIEGLCKQIDGSGCYPLATRNNCSYTYPNQIDCPQVAEYCVALGKERTNPIQVCRDHVGELLRHGPLYQIWPLED